MEKLQLVALVQAYTGVGIGLMVGLGALGACVGVRTVRVAVHVPPGYTVTFWMTSSARSVHACAST